MENEVTQMQSLEAEQYIKSFIQFNGGNPDDFDWTGEEPPYGATEDVVKAWDTFKEFRAFVAEEDIIT